MRAMRSMRHVLPSVAACVVAVVLVVAGATAAFAATGKVQGKVLGADTAEPIGFADIALVPYDSTLRVVGGLTNADGTYLLAAPEGRYALRVRALSYRPKRVEDVAVKSGELLPLTLTLDPEAIPQQEIVVDAKRRDNNEAAMLTVRRKAVAVGDAVSAEQVRKTPDKDAAEVLRRVTGLSVSDGRYVFVRGLGERYSSTEIDGVRIASPEQNKRVVPLDLFPSGLLENIIVQKTYTADRPGEFGGGDVQVHTKDFPGVRAFQMSVTQGMTGGLTFRDHLSYAASRADEFGFGAGARAIPSQVLDLTGHGGRLADGELPKSQLLDYAKAFKNIWSPRAVHTAPNGNYSLSYGDEFRVLGRQLGVIESWNLGRSYGDRAERELYFVTPTQVRYDYSGTRYTENVQLGGLSKLSLRLSPRHTLQVHGLYTNTATDEVRTYEGPDSTTTEAVSGQALHIRDTRLQYVQETILSGGAEGAHDFAWLGSHLDWKLTRSQARRQQPDRREYRYEKRYFFDTDGNPTISRWLLKAHGSREWGDLQEDGWGTAISNSIPYQLPGRGSGRITFGYDRQTKYRDNSYRRFSVQQDRYRRADGSPESVFAPDTLDGAIPDTGFVEEVTLPEDNYVASQRVEAGFLSADVPLGRRVRANVGVRYEDGMQHIRSYGLFHRTTTVDGGFTAKDWLPSGNVTWSVTDAVNLRVAGSRTLSRPDLTELSESPAKEDYFGGPSNVGNSKLERSRLDNYDVRIEAFPGLSEVLAVGWFHKRLDHPIERVLNGGSPQLLKPYNSDRGSNSGVELEARLRLERIHRVLAGFSINTNASFIRSTVRLDPLRINARSTVRLEHPLEGQADYLFNGGLSYATKDGRADAIVLVGMTGRRLAAIAEGDLGDLYDQPETTVDATLNVAPMKGVRLKLAGRNLINPRIRRQIGSLPYSVYQRGRSASISLSYGS